MLKKILTSPWTATITLLLVAVLRVADPAFVESVRLRYFDTLITSQPVQANDVVVVNIDEAAIDKYGQWPFKRDVYAKIIRDLYARGAGLVAFGVLTPEADRLGGDAEYAQLLSTHPVILPALGHTKTKNTPRNPGSAVIGSDNMDKIVSYPGIIANIPAIEAKAAGIGIVNTLPEIDGVVRRAPLVVASGEKLYPSLPLEVLRVAAGDTTFQVKLNELGVEKMRIPAYGAIATDSLGRVWIDWKQAPKEYSLAKLPANLNNAIVVVGVSAAGINNPVATAKGEVMPQVVQAATIATMLSGTTIQRPDWADGSEILSLIVLGLVLIFLTRYTYVGLGSVILLLAGNVIGSFYLFNSYLYLFDATAFVFGIILVALHAYGVKFVSEFLQKQQIKKQFGTYLSPAMVEKLQKNPELLQLGGESRELSIMFTDVRGFTTISEHYGKDVQGLTKIMNRYMTAMTARIIENGGTLDKYIGDAQMAFWNAPLDDAEHAKNAVRTGLAMLGDLDAFNKEIEAEGVPPFGMGLGINTAEVVVGNMGSSQRFDYTCLGDGVNLASRLEGQSKPYGVKIVIGPATASQVSDEFSVVELDCIAVKGKTEGVKIYTVTDFGASTNHIRFLDAYYAGDWAQAIELCRDLSNRDTELKHYYENMLERLQEGKPANWDGTYRATSK